MTSPREKAESKAMHLCRCCSPSVCTGLHAPSETGSFVRTLVGISGRHLCDLQPRPGCQCACCAPRRIVGPFQDSCTPGQDPVVEPFRRAPSRLGSDDGRCPGVRPNSHCVEGRPDVAVFSTGHESPGPHWVIRLSAVATGF